MRKVAIFCALGGLVCWSYGERVAVVRVGLLSVGQVKSIEIFSQWGFGAYDTESGVCIGSWSGGQSVKVSISGSEVALEGKRHKSIYFGSEGPTLRLGTSEKGRHYRGWLYFESRQGNLLIVNEVPLESYLLGVLACEMSPAAPLEALKAQAVAARTYAINRIGSLKGEPYDLDDTVRCQVYRGFDREFPTTNEAVRLTANQVLIYEGRPISAVFSTVSGGVTASSQESFMGSGQPYLTSFTDSDSTGRLYASGSKHMEWKLQMSFDEFEKTLSKSGRRIGKLLHINIVNRGPSGRVTMIEVVGALGTMSLSGAELRRMIGPDILRSTLFELSMTDKHVVFTGKGWGHGVGMCQAGAIGRAHAGQSYKEILAAYYPGTELVSSREPALTLATHGSFVSRIKHQPSKG
jgi:stage II sporulation protein D